MAPPQKSSFKVNDESSPEGHWQGKYNDFKALGDGLDIETFSKSAEPYSQAQGLLITTYEELTTQAYTLAELWQGAAAAEFQKNLKALYESACALADATGKVNVAIGYHASDLQTLKENVDKLKPDEGKSFNDYMFGSSWDPLGISHRTTSAEEHDNQADQAAQDWINKDLTTSTTTYTFTELPTDVNLEIPNPDPGKWTPTSSPSGPGGGGHIGSPGGGAGGAGGAPHLNTPNSHVNTPNPHLTSPTSHLNTPDPSSLGNHTGGGTDLAGLGTHAPTDLGAGGGGLTGGLGGGGGGLGGLGSHGAGLGGGGLGGGGLGGGGLGGGGLGGGGLGARGAGSGSASRLGGAAAEEAAAEEAAAARAAGAGKAGATGGMPMGMGGGSGGGQEQERERTTWLTEDEDVWGGDDDVAPPVIG